MKLFAVTLLASLFALSANAQCGNGAGGYTWSVSLAGFRHILSAALNASLKETACGARAMGPAGTMANLSRALEVNKPAAFDVLI